MFTLGTFLLNRVDLFPQIYQVKKKILTNIIKTGIKCGIRYTINFLFYIFLVFEAPGAGYGVFKQFLAKK